MPQTTDGPPPASTPSRAGRLRPEALQVRQCELSQLIPSRLASSCLLTRVSHDSSRCAGARRKRSSRAQAKAHAETRAAPATQHRPHGPAAVAQDAQTPVRVRRGRGDQVCAREGRAVRQVLLRTRPSSKCTTSSTAIRRLTTASTPSRAGCALARAASARPRAPRSSALPPCASRSPRGPAACPRPHQRRRTARAWRR